MKILRWIFGFPLATAIAIALMGFALNYSEYAVYASHIYFLSWLIRLMIIVFSFAIWVFLTCLFIPTQKRIAGLFPITVSLILVGYDLYEMLRFRRFSASEQSLSILSYVVVGSLIGYFASYIIFRNKGWGRKNKPRGFIYFEDQPF